MITTPKLPPKAGYVEVEVDGVRKYRSVETGYILGEEPEPAPEPEDTDAIVLETVLDHELRLSALELGV